MPKKGTVLRPRVEGVRVRESTGVVSVQAVAPDARFHFLEGRGEWWTIGATTDPRLYPWAAHPGAIEVHHDDVEIDLHDEVAAAILLRVAQRRFDLNVTPPPRTVGLVVAAVDGAFSALERVGTRNGNAAREALKEALAFALARDEPGAEAAMNRACTAIGL